MINPPPASELLDEMCRFRQFITQLIGDPYLDWLARPSPEAWSLTEAACHLRDVESEVHQPRFRAILGEDNAFIAGVDADEWAVVREYRRQDGLEAAASFIAARDKTISLLSELPAESWERIGQHTFFGPTTLRELVYLAVQHDRNHTGQIEELTKYNW
jgi:hypothetical protein